MRVLSETLGLKRPLKKISTLGVPIRYWVLNGEDLTNVDGLKRIKSLKMTKLYMWHISCVSELIVTA